MSHPKTTRKKGDSSCLPKGLKPYERYFAALLRSSIEEYIDKDNASSMELWTRICQRVNLRPPEGPTRAKYPEATEHFAVRAALVLEESRHAIAESLAQRWSFGRAASKSGSNKQQQRRPNNNNNTNQAPKISRSTMRVRCLSVERNTKTGHTAFKLQLSSAGSSSTKPRFTKDQLFHLRPGTVMEILAAPSSSTSTSPLIKQALLGCIMCGSREEIEKEATFSVMVFQDCLDLENRMADAADNAGENKSKSNNNTSQVLQVTPIAGLISELRQFEACTDKKSKHVLFLPALLGHWPKHIRFHYSDDEDSKDDKDNDGYESDVSSTCDGDDDDIISLDDNIADGMMIAEELLDVDEASSDVKNKTKASFDIPVLNPTQEEATSKFLGSSPGTITLVQGPPGCGKSHMICAILCRYLLAAPSTCPPRLMVCAPTNKAVTVVATRFLRAINNNSSYQILMVGDAQKLLETDDISPETYSKKNQQDNSPLRSIFIYSWLSSMVEEFETLRSTMQKSRTTKESNINLQSLALQLCQKLLRHLPVNTKGEIASLARKVCKELKQQAARGRSGGDCSVLDLSSIDELILKLAELKNDDVCRELLNTANVVFCTLSSAGASIFKWTHKMNDLIVDEASATTEPELCIPFHLRPRRLLVVGDPQQLPATVMSKRAVALGYDKSLHERLMKDCECPYIMLDIQYRMKPEISSFPSSKFYNGAIKNGQNVTCPQYRSMVPVLSGKPYSFLQVDGTEERAACGSYQNRAEAANVVALIQSLSLAASHGDNNWHAVEKIRVITFYRAQVQLVQALLRKEGLPRVLVATVDSSQGCEADLVIVSFVRSKGGNRISEGFLSDDRRVNVALTRAKYQLVCVGNAEAIMQSLDHTSTLHGLASNAIERSLVVDKTVGNNEGAPAAAGSSSMKKWLQSKRGNKRAVAKTQTSKKKRARWS